MNSFNNADEFLNHIKQEEARPLPRMRDPDAEFQRIHAEQTKDFPAEILSRDEPFDWLVEQLVIDLQPALSDAQRAELRNRVAIGCLEHEEVNARILRSEDGYCAIVLNKGLFVLVNKFVKVIAAAREPSAVIYCNRGPGLPRADYIAMGDEILHHYSLTGVPLGPRLKLQMNSAAMAFVNYALQAVELFILAHEVGHFFNGDLDRAQNYLHLDSFDASMFVGPASHKREFLADEFAFRSVMRVMSKTVPALPAVEVLLGSATITFNILRGIANRDSYSHPAASRRLLTIVKTFFGDKAAEIMEASFLAPKLVDDIRTHVGRVSVAEMVSTWPAIGT
jgi:hypothetical protein